MELHYVYYAIKEDGAPKVGATMYLNKRKREGKYQSIKVLEQYECPWKCGDREIELQLEYFGKRDSYIHYAQSPMFNKKHTDETKEKLSIAMTGKIPWNKGIPRTKECIDKIRNANKGNIPGNRVLKDDDVRFIRKHYFKQINQNTKVPIGMYNSPQLADMFNCSDSVILKIARGNTYKNVK